MKIYEQIEKAMNVICILEPVTDYQVQIVRNSSNQLGAMIDIRRQLKNDVRCFLEPQKELPDRNHIVYGILLACGWRKIGEWKPHESIN